MTPPTDSLPPDSPPGGPARDLTAGLVVFLVALPLCLGVALASNAPLFSGLLAGIVGGILVGLLSGSQTSVSGPAAGLTAVVAAQIALLGSFQAFLLAVVLAGLIQIAPGRRPGRVPRRLLPVQRHQGAAGRHRRDPDPQADPPRLRPRPRPGGGHGVPAAGPARTRSPNSSEIVGDLHPGAAVIGLLSIALLVVWDRVKPLKKSPVPAPLVVVLLGVGLSLLFRQLGGPWVIEPSHLVQVPVADDPAGFFELPPAARLLAVAEPGGVHRRP